MCTDGMTRELREKEDRLKQILSGYGSVAVALSGGVDSTLLLKMAVDTLGDKVIAVTAGAMPVTAAAGSTGDAEPALENTADKATCSVLEGSDSGVNPEVMEAAKNAAAMGVKHIVFQSGEFEDEDFLRNPPERCYICKKLIFGGILRIAAEHGVETVLEGTNLDDLGDFRPGMLAITELGVKSPLREAGLNKADIRKLAERYGLAVWNRPSNACLATRFPYGTRISMEKIICVGKAEQILYEFGFRQVRVRYHGTVARIELAPSEMNRIFEKDTAHKVYEQFRALGFDYTALDLIGYRTGSLNEHLDKSPAQE